MIIVWGTKVKQVVSGALALDCPACGERAVGDEYVVSTASHIYYIPGTYKEAGRYVRCRLCSMSVEVPLGATAASDVPAEMAVPDETVLLATNPELAEVTPEEPNPVRLQAALFSAILNCKEKQAKDGSASGLSGVLLLFVAIPAIIYLFVLTGNYPVLYVSIALGLVGVILFHNWILHRAIAKEMTPYIRRAMKRCSLSIDALIENAEKMDRAFRPVGKHLQRRRADYA